MYLQKGTYPVFLEMADRFFSIIQSQLANQDKNDESSISIQKKHDED